ncbi:hypothetical protein KVR01_012148 [Diaporthe batatas]|uniref:uncharacterized protein n=1 Tax=Diaporthe batatas TaxID=748121 RepID=UPI001D03A43E|nr:uncharacterized protein KVR01_012148 [Diaporthe batatas]KAG8157876.1 hypothetical protein KVR01_012148 [Diaporthe batatas]
MRLLSLPAPLLAIALSALFRASDCRPLVADQQEPKEDQQLGRFHAALRPLQPRASYSIVPIDGGSPATTEELGTTTTVVRTVTSSPTEIPEVTVTTTTSKESTTTVTKTDISVVAPEAPTTVTATAPVTIVTTHTRAAQLSCIRDSDELYHKHLGDDPECRTYHHHYRYHRPDILDPHILLLLDFRRGHIQHRLYPDGVTTTIPNVLGRRPPPHILHRPGPDTLDPGHQY